MISANDFKVDFLVPGFSKCGTTTLCDLLGQHPEIFMPQGDLKEPMYFIKPDYLAHEESYKGLFRDATDSQLIGEGSTFYSLPQYEHDVALRIIKHNPNIKLIFIARDPVKRIESSFREFHHSGHRFAFDIPYDFNDALKSIPALIQDTCYWSRLTSFRALVPDNQILVVLLEDLQSEPQKVLSSCYAFLGVDAFFLQTDTSTHLNAGEEKLFDSRLLRWLRNNPKTALFVSGMHHKTQDKIFRKLGLRKPFSEPIHWREESKELIRVSLEQEVRQFLEFAAIDKKVWKQFYSHIE